MPVLPSFGVMYKGKQTNWAYDIAYFNSIGLKNVRINLAPLAYPWIAGDPTTVGTNAYFRSQAAYFHQQGFWVTWGPSSPIGMGAPGTLTATLFSNYQSSVLSEASYLIANNIVVDEFELGNELEAFVDVVTLTQTQVRAGIRTLASSVKALPGWSGLGTLVSYATDNAGGNSGANFHEWEIENSLGGLDNISIHPYATVDSPTSVDFSFTQTWISGMYNVYGNKVYVSEFNLDANPTNLATLTASTASSAMTTFNNYILASGIPKYMVYSFVGYLNEDNQYAMVNTNNSVNPAWFSFFNSQPEFYATRTSTLSRGKLNRSNKINRNVNFSRPLIR